MWLNGCQDDDLFPDISGSDLNILYNEEEDEDEEEEDKAIKEERSKYMTRGLSLFENIGNTCYMDSVLQCLCYLKYLPALFLDPESWEKISNRVQENIIYKLSEQKRKNNKLGEDDIVKIEQNEVVHACQNTVTFQLKYIVDSVWKHNYNISARSFKQLMGNLDSEFAGTGQKDSQELNSMVLDHIHEETKVKNCKISSLNLPAKIKEMMELTKECKDVVESEDDTPEAKEFAKKIYTECCKKYPADKIFVEACEYWKNYIKSGYSLVTKLFTGLYYSRIVCSRCKEITSNFSPFSVFTIPTEQNGNITLEECLKKFSEEELLTDKNKYDCNKCGKVDAHKKMFVWEPPEILIVALKRFQNNGRLIQKTHTKVVFPIEGLELKDNYSDIRPIKNCVYDLTGIIQHTGSCYGGHYVSYCQNPTNNLWYHFDDLNNGFWHVPRNKLEEEIITKNAYMLFYVKQ